MMSQEALLIFIFIYFAPSLLPPKGGGESEIVTENYC